MITSRQKPSLILASRSPRRAALLAEYGYEFTIVGPPFAEPTPRADMTPAQVAEALSYFKARSVAGLRSAGWIISGDTVVSLGGMIFGKPRDRNEARDILAALAGTTHRVVTGVALIDAATDRRLVRHDVTEITMKPLDPPELEAYLDTGAWSGKAGAYGIQDCGDKFVTRCNGSFTNVVGFPMELIERMLADWL